MVTSTAAAAAALPGAISRDAQFEAMHALNFVYDPKAGFVKGYIFGLTVDLPGGTLKGVSVNPQFDRGYSWGRTTAKLVRGVFGEMSK